MPTTPVPIFDLHCHPILKTYLFNRDLTENDPPALDMELFNVRTLYTSLPKMRQGNVCGAASYAYLPEHGLLSETKNVIVPIGFSLLKLLCTQYADKIEDRRPSASFFQTLQMMRTFEQKVYNANAVMALNRNHFQTAFQNRVKNPSAPPVFIHALEGGHHLGLEDDLDVLKNRLRQYFDQGVAIITLGHFFDNAVVCSGGGLPPDVVKEFGYPTYSPDPQRGLKPIIGEAIVREMWELGMIVDLTHSTEFARQEIYKIHKEAKSTRPLIFSHIGTRSLFTAGAAPTNDQFLEPSDEEILQIQRTEGTIGVICMQYWLNGTLEANKFKFDHYKQKFIPLPDNSLDMMVKTIQHIAKVCGGSYDNISIGTDFDGFTDVPDDISSSAALQMLVDALQQAGLSSAQIEAVLYKNALRVLDAGWGKTETIPSL